MKKNKQIILRQVIYYAALCGCLLMGLGIISLLRSPVNNFVDNEFIRVVVLMACAFIPLLIFFSVPYFIRYCKKMKSIDRGVNVFLSNLEYEEHTLFNKIALDFKSGSIKGIFKILKNAMYNIKSDKELGILMVISGIYKDRKTNICFTPEKSSIYINDEELISYSYPDYLSKQKLYEAMIKKISSL